MDHRLAPILGLVDKLIHKQNWGTSSVEEFASQITSSVNYSD